MRIAYLLLLALFALPGYGEDRSAAAVNYMLHCQGCHLPQAEGFPGKVPRINGFVGYFLGAREGREYLIQVPGVATAKLDDAEVAELMNWMIDTFSGATRPQNFVPYTAAEVARLRRSPESDPAITRARILRDLAAESSALAEALDY